MKTLIALILITASAFATPAKKVSNREFPDGTWSSKEIDPEKAQSIERFYTRGSKVAYQTVVYKLDPKQHPESGIYYNAKNQIFQKCTYILDGEYRIIQEIVYDSRNTLTGTNNYIYGTRGGQSTLINVDRYDANGVLIPKAKVTKRTR